MRVRVLFFGMLKDVLMTASHSLELAEGARARDALQQCEAKFPHLKQLLPSAAIAINQSYAASDTPLKDGDEIAVLPPVSGGNQSAIKAHRVHIVRDRID